MVSKVKALICSVMYGGPEVQITPHKSIKKVTDTL